MWIMEPLDIDPRSSVPSYRQLADQLRAAVESGAIAPDELLPSLTRIRQETGLSVGTIRHAIDVLVEEEYAYVVPGRGTFAVRPEA
jgi:DNA-binding GntR family transcriptional regulator